MFYGRGALRAHGYDIDSNFGAQNNRSRSAGDQIEAGNLVQNQLGQLAQAVGTAGQAEENTEEDPPHSGESAVGSLNLIQLALPLLQELAEKRQVTVDAVFTATEDGKRGRITGVAIGEGSIELSIEPLMKSN